MRLRRPETNADQRRLNRSASIADLRAVARRRLPRGVFDYIDGGAEDERTMRENVQAFARYRFEPTVLRGIEQVDTATTLFGQRLPCPLVLAPTGFTRIAHPDGELAVARAAARAGLPYTLSTMSTRSIEEVAAVSDGAKWFQVYVWRDRGLVRNMLQRAHAAGYEAIVITVDTAVLGRRERDVRRGFTIPPKIGPATLIDGMLHPQWTWRFVRNEPILFANVVGHAAFDGTDPIGLTEFVGAQFDPTLSWSDVDWFRENWSGRIILKGMQRVDDALHAVDAGVDAIALSNHGGRQLDDAPPVLDLVAPVAEALGGRCPIICDGGVRRGSDIVKAIALGADACMIGRAYLYGLGAAGERGVDHVLGHLASGMARTMALTGVHSVPEIGPDLVARVDHPPV
jgi:L-lactate dehydrogenase (cytochrome)